MATTLLSAFQKQAENGASSQYSTTVFRSGVSSLQAINSSSIISFSLIKSGGVQSNFATSFCFYMRIDVMVSLQTVLANAGENVGGTYLYLNTNGTFTLADNSGGASATSSNALIADSLWHRIYVDVSGTTRTLYVDKVQWAQSTGGSTATAQPTFVFGSPQSGTRSLYFADLYVDDSSIGSDTAGVDYYIGMLLPTSGSAVNSWVNGGGGTGDISGGVSNLPPIGAAASTDGTKIKNAASGGNLDYVVTMQSYTAAGIPAGSTIHAVQALCNDGEEIATNTKAGALCPDSNPALTMPTATNPGSFDFGNDAGALGTFPTGWATHYSVVAENPSVTLSTAPTVRLRKISSTTRVVDVDLIALYVRYTPPPIANIILASQAVKRANFF